MVKLLRVALAPLLYFAVAGCAAPSDGAMVGLNAPDFELESVQSAAIRATMKQHQGKVVLLDFWATWCGPCHQVAPYLDEFYTKYHKQGLEAMAICPDSGDTRAKVQGYLASHPHPIPAYLDPNQIAASGYGATAFPTIVLVARNGKIVFSSVGVGPETLPDLDKKIQESLAQQ